MLLLEFETNNTNLLLMLNVCSIYDTWICLKADNEILLLINSLHRVELQLTSRADIIGEVLNLFKAYFFINTFIFLVSLPGLA